MKAIITILAIIIVAGGISISANGSLPGGALYGVKTGINEKVSIGLTPSVQGKATLEAEYAGRRLTEAAHVASENKLDSDVRTQLEANFSAYATRVKERVALFADKDLTAAADIVTNFQTALDAHARILASLAAQTTNDSVRTQLNALNARVNSEIQAMAKLASEIDAKIAARPDVKAAAEGRMTAAQNKITEVTQYIGRVETNLGAAATAEARAQLGLAQQSFEAGKLKLDAQAYGESFVLFSEALRIAQRAQQVAILQLQLDLKGQSNIMVPPGFNLNLNTNGAVNANTNASANTNSNVNANANSNGNRNLNTNTNTNTNLNTNLNANY